MGLPSVLGLLLRKRKYKLVAVGLQLAYLGFKHMRSKKRKSKK